mgnify:CR=1 FL=1
MSKTLHAHKLVVETARKMAEAIYEELAKDNNWPKVKPELRAGLGHKIAREKFIQRNLAKFLGEARSTLTEMLNGHYPESLKEEILDALIKDASLMRGRGSATMQ